MRQHLGWAGAAMGLLAVVFAGRATAADPVPLVRELAIEGVKVRVDPGPQVVSVELPLDRGFVERGESQTVEAPLFATPLATIPRKGGMLSAALLAHKGKQFDDGLYAAVELAAQRGGGDLPGKAALLRALAELLANDAADPAAVTIEAAARLGGLDVKTDQAMAEAVLAALAEFDAQAERSTPLSFYAWSPELSAIFRQDRMLQSELKGAGVAKVAQALHARKDLAASYGAHLDLAARLTNPQVGDLPGLRASAAALARSGADVPGKAAAPASGVYLFPPSRAPETDLVKRLFGNRPIPAGFSLADELGRRVRDRSIDLAPTKESGWYDWQTWSLETLAAPERAPEAAKLEVGPEYRKLLFELFKGLLSLTRETHLKQLEVPIPAAAPPLRTLKLSPNLRVEPLATYYLRRALGYRFVRGVLEAAFGKKALGELHRQGAEGASAVTLEVELAQLEALFLGAYACVCEDLGIAPAADAAAAASLPAFLAWRAGLEKDEDLGRDARAMVPLFYDAGRRKTKALVFLGWSSRPATARFKTPPKVEAADGRELTVRFTDNWERIVYPVTAELYVDKVRDRAGVRAVCDAAKTQSGIVAALSAAP